MGKTWLQVPCDYENKYRKHEVVFLSVTSVFTVFTTSGYELTSIEQLFKLNNCAQRVQLEKCSSIIKTLKGDLRVVACQKTF